MMGRNPLDMLERLPGDAQKQAYKKLTNKLIDGEAGDILTGLIAAKEISMLEAVDDLHAEMGVEHIDEIPNHDDRKQQLKELVEALVSGDIPAFWFEQIGRDKLDEPESARDYLNLDGDEWRTECDKLVNTYRKQGSTASRSEIVADYVTRKFGVDTEYFVSHVVNWTETQQRNVAKQFLLGNFDGVEQGINVARQAVEHHNEQAKQELDEGDHATAD